MIETAQDVRDTVIEMLTAELSCSETDLTDGKVHVRLRDPQARHKLAHRAFSPHPGRIGIATLGTGGVVCVDEDHLEWAKTTFSGVTRDELFMPGTLGKLSDRLLPENLTTYGPFPRFAASHSGIEPIEAPLGYNIRVVDRTGSETIEQREQWPNALFPDPAKTGRPTMIAGIAEHAGEIAAVCGASADSPTMWQLGIDVSPNHQGQGIASALVSAVTQAVLDAGKLPYYGTSSSNVPSMRSALSVGYKPTWIEVLSRPTIS